MSLAWNKDTYRDLLLARRLERMHTTWQKHALLCADHPLRELGHIERAVKRYRDHGHGIPFKRGTKARPVHPSLTLDILRNYEAVTVQLIEERKDSVWAYWRPNEPRPTGEEVRAATHHGERNRALENLFYSDDEIEIEEDNDRKSLPARPGRRPGQEPLFLPRPISPPTSLAFRSAPARIQTPDEDEDDGMPALDIDAILGVDGEERPCPQAAAAVCPPGSTTSVADAATDTDFDPAPGAVRVSKWAKPGFNEYLHAADNQVVLEDELVTTRYIIRIVEAWEGVEACVNICEMLLNAMRHVDYSDDDDDDGDIVMVGGIESKNKDANAVKVDRKVEVEDDARTGSRPWVGGKMTCGSTAIPVSSRVSWARLFE